MLNENELIAGLERLHTTEHGVLRIRRNLALDTEDVVAWCKNAIRSPGASIIRKGKNWYASTEGCIITVNAHSFTIITAHRRKN